MTKIITIIVLLFNLYISYMFGVKKEGLEFIAGIKKVKTEAGKMFLGNSVAIYFLIINIFLLLTLIFDIVGKQYILNIEIWNIYFYFLMIVTAIFVLGLNIYIKKSGI